MAVRGSARGLVVLDCARECSHRITAHLAYVVLCVARESGYGTAANGADEPAPLPFDVRELCHFTCV